MKALWLYVLLLTPFTTSLGIYNPPQQNTQFAHLLLQAALITSSGKPITKKQLKELGLEEKSKSNDPKKYVKAPQQSKKWKQKRNRIHQPR